MIRRGNRIAETGKKESRAFVYDETNHLVEGTNWKGDKSAYTYNALFVRINNTQTSHSGSVYSRDYVIDYTSLERDDLMIYAEGDGQLDYVQREVYAGSERIEQFTDRSNGGYERTLYVHEDVQGNTRYYTKTNGNSFAELTYDAWGMPVSPNKLLNNDHENYVYATYTGHIFDTTLDIYFAEARFYDAQTRTWLAMDPIKDGGNWYQYCFSNPVTNWDPTGLSATAAFEVYGCASAADLMLGVNQAMAFLGNTVETVGTVVATAIAAMTAAVAAAGAAVAALPTAVVVGGVVIITVVIVGVGVYVWSGSKKEATGKNSKLKQDVKNQVSTSSGTSSPNNKNDKDKNKNSRVPVKDKTKASNGLDYQSNPKHTPGEPGNRPNAGVEPKNSLELFEDSAQSPQKPNQRYTYDKTTNTLHRFFNDGNGTWHWSGSTNQGSNSLVRSEVPNDIIKSFGLPQKGW